MKHSISPLTTLIWKSTSFFWPIFSVSLSLSLSLCLSVFVSLSLCLSLFLSLSLCLSVSQSLSLSLSFVCWFGNKNSNEWTNVRLFRALYMARTVKSPKEIIMMQFAANVSSDAHKAVMMSCQPGMFEYQLESIFLYNISFCGCVFTSSFHLSLSTFFFIDWTLPFHNPLNFTSFHWISNAYWIWSNLFTKLYPDFVLCLLVVLCSVVNEKFETVRVFEYRRIGSNLCLSSLLNQRETNQRRRFDSSWCWGWISRIRCRHHSYEEFVKSTKTQHNQFVSFSSHDSCWCWISHQERFLLTDVLVKIKSLFTISC
jgi:hypothetical protein